MWVCRLPVHIGPAVCTVFRKSPANPWLPKGPTESSAPTTTLALSCRGGRLCPPADRTGFYGNLRRIRGCPAGRCGHRPLHDSGKFVLPANFECKAFLPQSFKGNYYQIWCIVTGGAYHSARKVSMCVRND